jgi:hypothetical protein
MSSRIKSKKKKETKGMMSEATQFCGSTTRQLQVLPCLASHI